MEQSKHSLRAFRTQYIASAAVMCDWLDDQHDKGVLGVHAALRALGQIVNDVTERQTTLAKAAGDAIGVEHDVNDERTYWTREVVDMSRVGLGGGEDDGERGEGGGGIKRHVVAGDLLKVVEEVTRLQELKDDLEEKWTQVREG